MMTRTRWDRRGTSRAARGRGRATRSTTASTAARRATARSPVRAATNVARRRGRRRGAVDVDAARGGPAPRARRPVRRHGEARSSERGGGSRARLRRRPAPTAGSTMTSARTGTPSTASTSARPSARPASPTSTTPDGRSGALTAAAEGEVTRPHHEQRTVALAATVSATSPLKTPASMMTGRGSSPSNAASTSPRAAVVGGAETGAGQETKVGRGSTSRRAKRVGGRRIASSEPLSNTVTAGSARPRTAAESPARSTSKAPGGWLRGEDERERSGHHRVPLPPLTDQQATPWRPLTCARERRRPGKRLGETKRSDPPTTRAGDQIRTGGSCGRRTRRARGPRRAGRAFSSCRHASAPKPSCGT